jgi:outer membrane receptor protein involved in Fe transport
VLSYSGDTASGANWVTSLNVANLFDRDPPIIASENQGGGLQSQNNQYDVFGRRYQLSVNYNF